MKKTLPSRPSARWRRLGLFVLLALMLVLTGVLGVAAQEVDEDPEPRIVEEFTIELSRDQNLVQNQTRIIASQDAFISSGQPNNNYGFATNLNLGYDPTLYQAMRMLVQFNLSPIPSDAQIESAELSIYQYASSPVNDSAMSFKSQYMKSSWSEGGVTWNNANYLGGSDINIGDISSSIGWKKGDVTDLIRDWHSGAHTNYGALITGDESVPPNNRMRQFWSNQKSDFQPHIDVVWSVACDTTPPTATVDGLPPYVEEDFPVTWSGFDSAPSGCDPSGINYYDVQYRRNGGDWHNWKTNTSSTSATFEGAENGSFYEFQARATDNAGNQQAWTGTQASTTADTEAPNASVAPLPEYTLSPNFTVVWSGTDNLSGIANYDVQWREAGGEWHWLIEDTTSTQYPVTGAQDRVTYEFRARATDNVGNTQPFSEDAQAVTTVIATPVSIVQPFDPPILKPTDPITQSFTVNWVGVVSAPAGTSITEYEIWFNYEYQGWKSWKKFPGGQTDAEFDFANMGLGDGVYGFEAIAKNSLNQWEPRNGVTEAYMIVDLADVWHIRAYLPVVLK